MITIKRNSMSVRFQRGSILPLMIVALPATIVMLSLAFDIGNMMSIKEQMQTAVDAGALAGAMEISRVSNLQVSQARQATSENGFTNGAGSVTVTVNAPSLGVCDAGKTGSSYVEVIASKSYNFYFMQNLMNISACAVAAAPSKKICLLTTGGTGITLSVAGNATVAVNGCGIQVNSNGTPAATTQGSSSGISSQSTSIVGTYSGSGTFNPTPQTGAPSIPDPFASVPAPVPPYPLTCTSNTQNFGTITLNPGVYCGGITAKNGTVTFTPGTYILLGGGLVTQSNGNLRSSGGVTFYNTCVRRSTDSTNCPVSNVVATLPTGCIKSSTNICGTAAPLSISSNGTVTLSAPLSGTYKNLLFFADRNITGIANTLSGGGSGDTYNDSIFYFPSQPVTMGGNTTLNGAVVSRSMTLQGSPGFQVNYSTAVSGTAALAGSRAFLQ